MSKPTLITEFGKMYVKNGLFFVPYQSWERSLVLVMSPGVGLCAAQQALRALASNVTEIARELVAGH